MSGTVGVIAQDTGRYTMFAVSLMQLQSPANTALDWKLTSDRIIGRNSLAQMALDRGSEWLMFIDDDHSFPHDILTRLLSHNKPVVGALYMQRQVPFTPIAYSEKTDGLYTSLRLTDHDPDDLVEVVAMGTGGMLIRSEVLRAVEYPWFEHGRASEDMMFCDKVIEAGFSIYVDLAARMGHFSPSAVWPSHDGEQWGVGFTLADGFNLTVPIDTTVESAEDAAPVDTA